MGRSGRVKVAVVSMVWAALMAGCAGTREKVLEEVVQPPTVSLTNVVISEIGREGVTLILEVEINNPNRVGLTLAKVDYQVEAAGTLLTEGTVTSAVALNPNGISSARVPLTFAYDALLRVFLEAVGRESVPYTVSGKVWIKMPVGSIPLPYQYEDEFPVELPQFGF